MDKAMLFLCKVDAYPYEFGERERIHFSHMHPELPEASRMAQVAWICRQAGYYPLIVRVGRVAVLPTRTKREWVEIL